MNIDINSGSLADIITVLNNTLALVRKLRSYYLSLRSNLRILLVMFVSTDSTTILVGSALTVSPILIVSTI